MSSPGPALNYLGERGTTRRGGWRGDRYWIWEDATGGLIAYLLATASGRRVTSAAGYGKVIGERHPALAGRSCWTSAITTWLTAAARCRARRGTETGREQMPSRLPTAYATIWRFRLTASKP